MFYMDLYLMTPAPNSLTEAIMKVRCTLESTGIGTEHFCFLQDVAANVFWMSPE